MATIPLQTMSSNSARLETSNAAPTASSSTSTHLDPQPRPRKTRVASQIKYWYKPALAFLIYGLTLYISSSAPSRHTVLGRVSAPLGTWLLTLFAKAGDIAFAIAVADTIDTMTWRKLKERVKINGEDSFVGIKLDWFLSLISSTGVEGLIRILARSPKAGWWKHTAGRWALIRLTFIFALIPGPGVILMANVRQKDVFYPIRTLSISGGLADYDPQLAATYSTVIGPFIAKYVQTMLHDPSIAWPLDAITKECKNERSCTSSLIAGPYQTITPWPFTIEDDDVDTFRIYNAPFYQVDLWYPPTSLTFSESQECTLYGGSNRTSDFSMALCISQQSSPNLLAAGWKSCQLGYAENGTCLAPGAAQDEGWSTYAQFFRRRATVTFSRSDFTIKEVSDLSTAEPYNISPRSLFEALNNVLYRPNNTSNDARFDTKSQQYVLTGEIAGRLWYSLHARLAGLNEARDWLRNLLVFPLYAFQPTVTSFSANLAPVGGDNGSAVQPNLPLQNYVEGAYCVTDNRSIPSWGTVLAYAIVAGVLLVFVGAGKLVATLWPAIETSEFPTLDFAVLAVLAREDGKEVGLKSLYPDPRRYEQRRLLDDVENLRIGLRHV
ncbi:hypothetical protein EJ04DRAFT_580265 [Polyplosphaeria fusca]|uniref:Uncharacterized protein n=1 Tax=Polyplosphaeria fusca TaxID=682080 RepID=A0A9P4QSD2_9PLEO|nr:hypothetical protein EJ04DRAFT_580265 [Polyplosphaeria fusca]